MHTTIWRRLRAAALAVALPVALLALPTPALAASVGSMSLTADSGNQDSTLDANTTDQCPAQSAFLLVELTGPGIAADATENNLMGVTDLSAVGINDDGGYILQITDTFKTVFQANSVTNPDGTYTLRLVCLDDAAFEELGDMSARVEFTPTAGDYNGTWVQLESGDPTTTALATTPLDPIKVGTATELTATVTPSDATGSVQFKRGNTNLGAAVSVTAGVATATRTLPAGSAALTAVFTPTAGQDLASSTSAAVNYVVVDKPAISGKLKVDGKATCALSAGGTQTFAWLKDGDPQAGFNKQTVVVPASWYKADIACQATVTKSGRSLEQTSAAKTVGIGDKLVAKKKPAVTGTAKVGKTLTCDPGKWSPKATTYKFSWLRNGKAIKSATKAKYKLVAADKGKKVSCKVTAVAKGHTNGTAASKAVSVS